MLNAVSIENIAVAKTINIDFSRGFHVLTGSTGAGKSLVVTSLGLLSGDKFKQDMLRSGEDHASVSGVFSMLEPFKEILAEKGIFLDEDGQVQITRNFFADGRSNVHINGKIGTLSQLKDVSSYLIQINGQSDSHALGDRKLFISYLDEYAGIEKEVDSYHEVYENVISVENEMKDKKRLLSEQKLLVDLYKSNIKEIDSAKLNDPDEKQKVEKLLERIKGIEKISKYANLVYRALVQNEKGASATYMLEKAENALQQLEDSMDHAVELSERLKSIRYELEDIGNQAINVLDGLDVENPEQQIDILENRLDTIHRLEKKYGGDISSVISYREDIYQKYKVFVNADTVIQELQDRYNLAKEKAIQLAKDISQKRNDAALRLEQEIRNTLSYLDMPKVQFITNIIQTELNAKGIDQVEFLLSANEGETPLPLDKIASGGEMARVMLALKCALANLHGVDCIIFDEIDTGVSGSTSEKIGMKLKALSGSSQVICVTHSPQIASKSDHHFLIAKETKDGRTQSYVHELNENERITEIARMISGINISDTQRSAAKDLLNSNN